MEIVYGAKVTEANDTANNKTEVLLENGKSITCDVYIPAYGVAPNTDWLPEDLKGNKGYVATNTATLRVDKAGPRVYAAGDVAGVDRGGVMAMYTTIPILGSNIAHDLFADAKTGSASEKTYAFKEAETQLVPVSVFHHIELKALLILARPGRSQNWSRGFQWLGFAGFCGCVRQRQGLYDWVHEFFYGGEEVLDGGSEYQDYG